MSPTEDRLRDVTPVEREAHAWMVTLTSGKATEADAEALKAWCEQGVEHRQALARARRVWQQVGVAGREVGNWQPLPTHGGGMRRMRRRAFLGSALAAPAAVGALALWHPPMGLWPSFNELRADYRTRTGQQRRLELTADTVVELDAQTSISLRPASGAEGVAGLELISGRAGITTQVPTRLEIRAADTRALIDPGPARLDIRHLDGAVCVTCLSGQAQVEQGHHRLRLRDRQQVTFGPGADGGIALIDPQEVSSWQQGVLVFRQAALADVVEELNRYRAGKVVLVNSRIAREPVSGRFRIDDPQAALEQLRLALGLDMDSYPGGVVLLG